MRAIMARLRGPRSATVGLARAEGGPVAAGQIYDDFSGEGGPEPVRTYQDALREAHVVCRNLGLGFGTIPTANVTEDVGDLVRFAYSRGWLACEARLASPNMADQIDAAIRTPEAVVEKLPGESVNRQVIRAIQHTVAYGVKSELH